MDFLKDPHGQDSSMRALVAFVVLAIVGTWSAVSIRTNAIQPMDMNSVIALVGALGAKAYQRGKEVLSGPTS